MDIETIRTEALRKLGRNVVNFAKIEAGLKLLLSISQFEGMTETTLDQLDSKQTRLRKQTLGRLVQKFNENIVCTADQVDSSAGFPEAGMSFSFKVTSSNPESLKARKLTLSAIVNERNNLIHQDLAYLDTTSVEDYRKLIDLLDEQNPRLLAHLEDLKWMIDSLGEGLKEFQALVKSPEFLQHIQSSQTDTNKVDHSN